jgi:hypothetical protein
VRPDDRWLVSYPRSGNTWVSFLLTTLGNLDDPTTFANLESRCPDIYGHTDRFLEQLPSPRMLKSHEPYTSAYSRILYLVRDPRDVAVSYYRFLLKVRTIDAAMSTDEFLDGFIAGRWGEGYGSWGEHVGSWLGALRHDSRFHLLRYEDLHAQPVPRLQEAAAFLGIETTEAEAARAVELCSSDRMREHERRESSGIPELKDTRQDIPFIGSATVGRGAAELSAAQLARIEAGWGDLMKELGYADSGAAR